MKRSNKVFLDDILESIEKIEQYTKGLSYDEFAKKQMVIDAVVRNLEIIGEAAKNIKEDVRKQHADVPWNRMIGLRNIIAHGYFGVDLTIVWRIVSKNLPEIKPFIVDMSKNLE